MTDRGTPRDEPMPKVAARAIRKHYDYLVENMNSVNLVRNLCSREIISFSEMYSIKSKFNTREVKNRVLLQLLLKRGLKGFLGLIQALRDQGYNTEAKKLQHDYDENKAESIKLQETEVVQNKVQGQIKHHKELISRPDSSHSVKRFPMPQHAQALSSHNGNPKDEVSVRTRLKWPIPNAKEKENPKPPEASPKLQKKSPVTIKHFAEQIAVPKIKPGPFIRRDPVSQLKTGESIRDLVYRLQNESGVYSNRRNLISQSESEQGSYASRDLISQLNSGYNSSRDLISEPDTGSGSYDSRYLTPQHNSRSGSYDSRYLTPQHNSRSGSYDSRYLTPQQTSRSGSYDSRYFTPQHNSRSGSYDSRYLTPQPTSEPGYYDGRYVTPIPKSEKRSYDSRDLKPQPTTESGSYDRKYLIPQGKSEPATYIRGDPMPQAEAQALAQHHNYLVGNINASLLVDYLFSHSTINQNDVNSVKSQSTTREKNSRLLSILKHRGKNAFPSFVRALNTNGYEDQATRICRSPDVVSPRKKHG